MSCGSLSLFPHFLLPFFSFFYNYILHIYIVLFFLLFFSLALNFFPTLFVTLSFFSFKKNKKEERKTRELSSSIIYKKKKRNTRKNPKFFLETTQQTLLLTLFFSFLFCVLHLKQEFRKGMLGQDPGVSYITKCYTMQFIKQWQREIKRGRFGFLNEKKLDNKRVGRI